MSPELPEALRVALEVIEGLEELGVPYHLGGSYASSIHGVPRQTQDIDLIVELEADAVAPLAARFHQFFYLDEESIRIAIRRKSSFNLVHLDTGIKVDLFVRGDEPFDKQEFERARPEIIQPDPQRSVIVKTAEDILLRKLQWYRLGGESSDRQWTDIVGIARTQDDRLDEPYLERWAARLGVEDLLRRALETTRLGE